MNAMLPRTLQFEIAATQIQHLFATPVVVAPVADAALLNQELAELILDRSRQKPGVQRSNAGGWQSADDFGRWSGAAGKALLTAARTLADSVTAIQSPGGLQRRAPEWRINAWANINRAGDANHVHHHPAAFWSGVYWVDAGGTDDASPVGGEFEIVDPRGILPAFYAPTLRYAVPGCLSAGSSDFIAPASGTLLLFPSWLVHSVRPYRGTRPRISIAFNFSV